MLKYSPFEYEELLKEKGIEPMIGFSLTEEQIALQTRVREFAQREILPKVKECDENGTYPMDIMKLAYEARIMNDSVPVAYGGPGYSNLDSALIAEELGAACMGMGTSILANSLALSPIILFGSDEQKEKYLRWQYARIPHRGVLFDRTRSRFRCQCDENHRRARRR